MVMIVTAPEVGMDYAMYGDRSHVVSGYIQQQLQAMPVYGASNQYHDRIVGSMQASHTYLTDTSIRNQVAQTLRRAGVDLGDTFIMELNSYEQLNAANLTMQRWIMAQPHIRQMYLDQNLDGYGDTYVNTSGKYVGEQDYNYQLVMSGVPVDNGDGTETIRFYNAEDDLLPGDRILDHHEKVAIQHTWANAWDIAQEMRFDFTNKSEVRTKINFE